jgi:iron-sulfur cluster assembly accessory protein
MIDLSQAAANEIKRLQESCQQIGSYFRIGVKAGGCSGLYYTLELSATPQAGDCLYESQGISIIVDAESESYLQTLKLDYAEDLMGGGFRFQNPNASTTCGCGLSFS